MENDEIVETLEDVKKHLLNINKITIGKGKDDFCDYDLLERLEEVINILKKE